VAEIQAVPCQLSAGPLSGGVLMNSGQNFNLFLTNSPCQQPPAESDRSRSPRWLDPSRPHQLPVARHSAPFRRLPIHPPCHATGGQTRRDRRSRRQPFGCGRCWRQCARNKILHRCHQGCGVVLQGAMVGIPQK